MTQLVDALLFTAFAVFCFVMAMAFEGGSNEAAPYVRVICLFLSVASFGAAGYRATH
jgi:hypothetical protein